MSGNLLSIVIPVKSDPGIFELLKQIRHQPNEDIRVVVVMNGSRLDFVNQLLKNMTGRQNWTISSISKADIAAARNEGIKLSNSVYILFLDSDCLLTENYIKNITSYLSHRNSELISRGTVHFISRKSLFSKLNSEMRERSYTKNKKACYAPNLVISSSIFDKVGCFRSGIGYGVDTEWGRRAELAGYSIDHMPGNIVIGHIDDSTAFKTIRTWFNYGMGRAYREKRHFLLGKSKKIEYFKSLFPRSNLVERGDNLFFIIFVGFHYFIRTLGVLFGVVVKWRSLSKTQNLN